MFKFSRIEFAHFFWIIIPLVFLIYIRFKIMDKSIKSYGNHNTLKRLYSSTSRKRQILKSFILLIAIIFVIFSLLGPQIGTSRVELKRKGLDLLIALDISNSMLTEDVKPSRLEWAKYEISRFINDLRGDRVGLIVFAGASFLESPLTLDYNAFNIFLDVVDTDLIQTQGTAMANAIETALQSFPGEERKYKVLVIITDGEDHEGNPEEAAKEAAARGVIIYTVGVGTPSGGPIPLYNPAGELKGFKKDKDGKIVTSKLNEEVLQRVAEITGGKYFRMSGRERALDHVLKEIGGLEKRELKSMEVYEYEDRFQYLLVIAIIMLIFEPFISERSRLKR
ncbi:MAG: VWA domain-containing protein [Fidelibacterota bacterium]